MYFTNEGHIQHLEKIVLESLFILISLLCTGHQEEEKESDADLKPRILSICQDILFLGSWGRKPTPKHKAKQSQAKLI